MSDLTAHMPEESTDTGHSVGGPDGAGGPPSGRDRLKGLLALEGIALGIALAAPVTPSKTGSTWTPGELVTPDPCYLQDVVASFVLVNLMIGVLAVLVWIVARRDV